MLKNELRRALVLPPGNPMALYNQSNVHCQTGDYRRAGQFAPAGLL